MLKTSRVEANIPAADLDRARTFYADKLGLTPARELAGETLAYRTESGTRFNVYRTTYAGQAGHTIAQWHVDDIASEVEELKAKGVGFEHYDMPGVEWEGDVAVIKGMGKAAWFKDSEGNVMCLDQNEAPA
ncbi:VOC family protein [Geodermatophilus sp. YIM 151500]|uniref:VOC family protein n=1 Tax=Geodermatophilus sp. YIM 151500 TaxID=2984531 RepID=UPI0021E45923|nr:VOC family protein [Geodermatophilus sp. YIM 151500]MCV2489923.1 VOC family protein [Geodermatophilus sp. YIM 151500]